MLPDHRQARHLSAEYGVSTDCQLHGFVGPVPFRRQSRAEIARAQKVERNIETSTRYCLDRAAAHNARVEIGLKL